MEDLAFLGGLLALLPLIMIWSLVWKGMALWRAAKNDSKNWFIALLLINTMGILEILYLYVWGKKQEKPTGTPTAPTTV
jgi:methionyl-tRNA synthetase